MKIAILQIEVSNSKEANIKKVEQLIKSKKNNSVDMFILPEMFICSYKINLFLDYAEMQGGDLWIQLSKLASKYGVYLVAGSVPEFDDGHIYNTSYVFNRNGKQIGKHRKIHLCDIEIGKEQGFRESDVISVGYEATVFSTEFGKIGLCICSDFRFPELSRIMVDQGAEIIIVPSNFNITTGSSHWDILFRTRALDNQVYTIGIAPAKNDNGNINSWGHSLVVSPWGEIVNQLDQKENVMICEIDTNLVTRVRENLPLLSNRRFDIY
jgi:predicted amidohydrolase